MTVLLFQAAFGRVVRRVNSVRSEAAHPTGKIISGRWLRCHDTTRAQILGSLKRLSAFPTACWQAVQLAKNNKLDGGYCVANAPFLISGCLTGCTPFSGCLSLPTTTPSPPRHSSRFPQIRSASSRPKSVSPFQSRCSPQAGCCLRHSGSTLANRRGRR